MDAADIVGIIVAAILGYSALLGPQLLRTDLRSSLAQADILKTLPMRGWQIVLGEILASTLLLAVFQWLFVLIGMLAIVFLPGRHEMLMLMIGGSALFVLPVLDFLLLLVPNASVILFPSWFSPGKTGPQGIEATGQRLIMALVQFFAFLIALIPAALAFCAVYFLLRIPARSLGADSVCLAGGGQSSSLVEAGFGVMLLGKVFEKLDLSEEQLN